LFFIFYFFNFFYSYVHTRLGSFPPPAPIPSLTTHSTPSHIFVCLRYLYREFHHDISMCIDIILPPFFSFLPHFSYYGEFNMFKNSIFILYRKNITLLHFL
jgi:hypothetical protein